MLQNHNGLVRMGRRGKRRGGRAALQGYNSFEEAELMDCTAHLAQGLEDLTRRMMVSLSFRNNLPRKLLIKECFKQSVVRRPEEVHSS